MLIKMAVLERIRTGEITHVYRRWKKPAAKVGGRQRSPVGELGITSVEVVALGDLDAGDARRGGYESVDALRAELASRNGDVYRIGIRWERPDPRLALREDISEEAVAEVVAKLNRKDARSGPWTLDTLSAIGSSPGKRAVDIAEGFGLEKKVFKRRVRQLKELGLTISLDTGYRLSPRGEAVLEALHG